STQKSLEGQLTLNSVKNREFGTTLKEQSTELAVLKNAYASLTEEQKKSAAGKDLLKNIQELDKSVKDADASIGNFQRNVGNYPKIFDLSTTTLGKMQQMLVALAGSASTSGQMMTNIFNNLKNVIVNVGKAFLTPPVAVIAIILSGIVLVAQKVSEAFKKNDDASTRLQRSMAVFQPTLTLIGKLFDKLAVGISYVVEWMVKLMDKFSKINPIILAFNAIFPKTAENMKLAKTAAQELVTAEDNLEETKRKFAVNEAARNSVIARLTKEARDSNKLSAEEREKLLKRADALELKNLEDRKKIAAEELRILTQKAKQNNDTSDEIQDKIAQATAEMYRAEKEYYDGTQRLAQRQIAVQNELAEERKRKAEEARQLYEKSLQDEKERQEKLKSINRELEDAVWEMKKDGLEKEKQLLEIRTRREIEDIQERLKTEKNLTKEAKENLTKLIEQLKENQKLKEKEIEEKYSREQFNKEIENEQNRISKLLEITVKGTENEYNLKVQQIELLRKKELSDTTLTEEQKKLINDYYDNQELEAQKQLLQKKQEQLQLALDNEFNLRKLYLTDNEQQLAQLELEQATLQYQNLLNLDTQTKNALYQSEEQYTAAVIAAKQRLINADKNVKNVALQTSQAQLKSLSDFSGAVSQIFTTLSANDAKMADFQYALALFKIGLDTAAAISSATASATKGDPYTIPLRVATAVASAIAAMASATKALKEAKKPKEPTFEYGGIVGGNSFTGDKITARVNSGEMILNQRQQAELWKIVAQPTIVNKNTFDYETLTNLLTNSLSKMPSPILDYKEFTEFQNRLTIYKEFTTI
ncbi:MAG TPA: hypothetical protein PLB74_02200, partial [Candidatus Paceibacterota bacterium]|nr:hypothetical protein [Candidatus Paceibacterota bacterium]